MRLLALLLALAGGLVTAGVAMWSLPSALIVGGVLLAAWTLLVFAEVRG